MSAFNLQHVANNLSMTQAKEYVTQHFIPLTNGNHAVLNENGTYSIINDETVKKVYFKRMSKELNNFYFTEYTGLKTITYELNKDTIIGNKLNLCPKMKHEYIPFESFDESTKESMNLMLSFIKEVICGNKEDSFIFTLKWLSNMIRGNKNNSCLYLKTVEGVGKSTLFTFIREFVIGENLSLETGSKPLKSNFNSILEGKLMVVFEELENFGMSEWSAISSTLKRIITSNTYLIEGKNINSYETINMNNYVLISNNDSIKEDDGRRYMKLDVSTIRKKDHIYFGNLRNKCYNDTVGHAFYCYMLEYDITNFNPQAFPKTSSKMDSIVKLLDSVELFLKHEYILNHYGIDRISVQDLHQSYKEFCAKQSKKAFHKIDFNKRMAEMNFNFLNTIVYGKRTNIYDISYDDLLKLAKAENWIHDLDDFSEDEDTEKPSDTQKSFFSNAETVTELHTIKKRTSNSRKK